MPTNVKAYYVSASTTLTDAGGRLRGLNVVGNGAAALGKVTLREGGQTDGNIVLEAPTMANGSNDIFVPESGIRFNDGLHITVPTSVHATVLVG
jgi:hypothetical protein|tara:strand:+ start:300 stop:581 length:282 start_codon:yes stop_codon:yes gene_type:complete